MKMKKIICFVSLLLVILFLIGCEGSQTEMEYSNIEVTEGIYPNKNWDDIMFPISETCVPDKETAVSLARNMIVNFQKNGKFIDYVPQSVFYDTQDHIWIISFWEDIEGYIGASFSIAIKEDNAQVVKMWVDE